MSLEQTMLKSRCENILTEDRLFGHVPVEEISNDDVIAFFFLYMPDLVDRELTDKALEQIRMAVIHYRDKYPKLIIDAKYAALIDEFNTMLSGNSDTIYHNPFLRDTFATASPSIVNNLNNMFNAIGEGSSPKNFAYREYFNMLPKADPLYGSHAKDNIIPIISSLRKAISVCLANLPNEDAIDFLAQLIEKVYGGKRNVHSADDGAATSKLVIIKKYMDNFT